MNTWVLLMIATLAAISALFVALAIFLFRIIAELEVIGGERVAAYGTQSSFLSKIRMGVRAIEVQTRALPVLLTTLNSGLSAVAGGLRGIDQNLGGVIEGVSRQNHRGG